MSVEQANISDEIEIRDQSGDPFTTVWNWMLDRSDLTGTEKLVWISLKSYAGCPEIRPSVHRLARRAGVSIRTAQRCLEVLKNKELIRTEKRTRPDGGDATNRYILLPSPRKNATGTNVDMTPPPRCHGDTPPGDKMAPPRVSPCHPKENIKIIKNKTSTSSGQPKKAFSNHSTPDHPDGQGTFSNHDVDDIKKLVKGTSFQKIGDKALRMFISKYGSTCIFESLDQLIVIYKRNGRIVKDPVAVLAIALLNGIIPPLDFVPYHERMKIERKAREEAEQRRIDEMNRKKADDAAFNCKLKQFEALPEQERVMWLYRAKSTLSPALSNSKYIVRNKAIELYSRGP